MLMKMNKNFKIEINGFAISKKDKTFKVWQTGNHTQSYETDMEAVEAFMLMQDLV
jgi:hypothetical protein